MWFLERTVFAIISQMFRSGVAPTAEQQIKIDARMASSDTPRILNTAGSNAEIIVEGILTKAPDFLSMFFGGGNVTYSEIIAALAVAEADPEVENITMAIDSPGGEIAGLFELLETMRATTKPIKAVVSNVVASAAYAIAAECDEIVAINRAVNVGSIGVKMSFAVDENEVTLTSTEAPNKDPDPTTADGKAVLVAYLDEVHDLFVESIASGRNTTTEQVNAEFGRGGVFLADEALERGMIDGVASASSSAVSTTANSGITKTEARMDLTKLRAEHPELFAQVVQIGVDQERDRVSAHLVMGESSGAMETAVKAVKEGTEMTATLNAEYMSAGMNKANVAALADDNAEAAAALEGAAAVAPAAGAGGGDDATAVAAAEAAATAVGDDVVAAMGLANKGAE